jgi:enamine deaminase RidA (YjgF/YER057c/UK114 family)
MCRRARTGCSPRASWASRRTTRSRRGAEAQADLCFAAIDAILQEAGFDRADTVRINAFVTDRAHMGGYMAARDRWCAGMARLPASTLVIVAGFTRPEFKVEVEVAAARLPVP